MNRRSFLSTLLAVLIVIPVSGHTETTPARDLLDRINNGGTIVVGTEGTYPPFTYHDATGKLTGYDVEVVRAIADKLGVNVRFQETPWDRMFTSMNNHEFDMIANQVELNTPARRSKYDSSTHYSYSSEVIATHKDNHTPIQKWEDIKGLRSAQSLTSNYSKRAKQYGAELVGATGLEEALEMIAQNHVDITINDRLSILDFIKNHPDAPVKIAFRSGQDGMNSSGLVLHKGNKKTLAKLNKAIKQLREEGKLQQISIRFFGEDISQP